jgi:hypothetical protein
MLKYIPTQGSIPGTVKLQLYVDFRFVVNFRINVGDDTDRILSGRF